MFKTFILAFLVIRMNAQASWRGNGGRHYSGSGSPWQTLPSSLVTVVRECVECVRPRATDVHAMRASACAILFVNRLLRESQLHKNCEIATCILVIGTDDNNNWNGDQNKVWGARIQWPAKAKLCWEHESLAGRENAPINIHDLRTS